MRIDDALQQPSSEPTQAKHWYKYTGTGFGKKHWSKSNTFRTGVFTAGLFGIVGATLANPELVDNSAVKAGAAIDSVIEPSVNFLTKSLFGFKAVDIRGIDDSRIYVFSDEDPKVRDVELQIASQALRLYQFDHTHFEQFADALVEYFPNSLNAQAIREEYLKAYSNYGKLLDTSLNTLNKLGVTPESILTTTSKWDDKDQIAKRDAFQSYIELVQSEDNLACLQIIHQVKHPAKLKLAISIYELFKNWEGNFDELFYPISNSKEDKKTYENTKKAFLTQMNKLNQLHALLIKHKLTPEVMLSEGFYKTLREPTLEEVKEILSALGVDVTPELTNNLKDYQEILKSEKVVLQKAQKILNEHGINVPFVQFLRSALEKDGTGPKHYLKMEVGLETLFDRVEKTLLAQGIKLTNEELDLIRECLEVMKNTKSIPEKIQDLLTTDPRITVYESTTSIIPFFYSLVVPTEEGLKIEGEKVRKRFKENEKHKAIYGVDMEPHFVDLNRNEILDSDEIILNNYKRALQFNAPFRQAFKEDPNMLKGIRKQVGLYRQVTDENKRGTIAFKLGQEWFKFQRILGEYAYQKHYGDLGSSKETYAESERILSRVEFQGIFTNNKYDYTHKKVDVPFLDSVLWKLARNLIQAPELL